MSLQAVPTSGQPAPAASVVDALDRLESSRRGLALGLYFGDAEAMRQMGETRAQALEFLDRAATAPELDGLSWPDRARWLRAALEERREDWSRALYAASGDALPPRDAPTRPAYALALALTILEAGTDSAEAARPALLAALDPSYLLWDEAAFRLWRLERARNDSLAAWVWADSLCRAMPRSLRTPHTRITRARALAGAGRHLEAVEENRLAIPVADGPETRTAQADWLIAAGRPREAAIELEYLIGNFAWDPRAEDAMDRRLDMAATPGLEIPPADRLRLWESLFALPSGRAIATVEAMANDTTLARSLREDALIRLCRFEYKSKRYAALEPRALALISGGGAHADEARLILARVYRNTGRIDEMEPLYTVLAAPGHPQAATALWELAREYESLSRYAEAAATYTKLLAVPGHSRGRDAVFRRGFDRYRQGDLDGAAGDFREALARSRDQEDIEQAAFWLAKALRESGQSEAAERAAQAGLAWTEPADYYGVRLRAERNLPGTAPERSTVAPITADTPLASLAAESSWAPSVRDQFLRALALVELGQTKQARQEWERAAETGKGDADLFVALTLAAVVHDVYPEAVRWAYRARSLLPGTHEFQEGLACFTLPAAYYGETTRQAGAWGFQPALLWALMRQESLYDPVAVSVAGARGVMQIMPATLERMTREGTAPRLPTSALFRPDVNIALGTRFLSDRYAEFDRELLPTLASYNAGEGKVVEWQKRAEGDTGPVFVECIGYPETYKYVRRIPWLQWKYETYYGRGEAPVAPSPEAR